MEQLIFFSNLEELDICQNQVFSKQVTKDVQQNIEEILVLATPNLRQLCLGGVVNDESCKSIGNALKSFQKITHLKIHNAEITELGLMSIFEFGSCLRSVEISNCKLCGSGEAVYKFADKLENLRHLKYSTTKHD